MHGSPELLEFYLVEATEYLDALDQLIGSAETPPDGNAFIATARALRGTSTMAKADAIAELAVVMEQIANGVREGEVGWTVDLYRSLRHTIDDLRLLVRGIRVWGERESARAEARLRDLRRFLPMEVPRAAAPGAAASAPVFVALQASAIAAELDAFVHNPTHRRALDDALTRSRTLRGIAGIADFAPLADVADAIDKTARGLMPDAPLSDGDAELFRSAAVVLRTASDRLRSGGVPHEVDEVARFARAVTARDARTSAPEPERVMRIEELFYGDAGPHVVQRAAAPPMSADDRLRQDMAARAEHVQRLAGDARLVQDVAARDRVARDLRAVLLDIERAAAAFGVHQVAGFFGGAAREHNILDATLLAALDAGAALLVSPGTVGAAAVGADTKAMDEIERRLAVLERARRRTPAFAPVVSRVVSSIVSPVVSPAVTPLVTPVVGPVTAPTLPTVVRPPLPAAEAGPERGLPSSRVPLAPARAHGLPRRTPATPTGRELQDLLQVGIAGFQPLEDEPLNEPARLDGDEIVAIEDLLYRGQSALRRAVQVRDDMRARGTTDDVVLQEIYDLLDLARTE